ncbi:MAG: hypothetical protein EPO68_11055, partial [Planctomycetota bacterium]
MSTIALGFGADARVAGAVAVPTSKSIAQRLLVLASLAHGRSEIDGLSTALDVQAALAFAEQAATSFERLGAARCAIGGRSPAAGGLRARAPIDVRESA